MITFYHGLKISLMKVSQNYEKAFFFLLFSLLGLSVGDTKEEKRADTKVLKGSFKEEESLYVLQRKLFDTKNELYEARESLKLDRSFLKLVESKMGDIKSEEFHSKQANLIKINSEKKDKASKENTKKLYKKQQSPHEKSLTLHRDYLLSETKEKQKKIKALERKKDKILLSLKEKRKNTGLSLAPLFDEARGKLSSPCDFCVIEKGFGSKEKFYSIALPVKGVHYRLQKKDKARSVFRGKVVLVKALKGYGHTVILKHKGDYYTVYTGLKSVHVTKGELVGERQTLGQIQRDFYFEIREFDEAVDPTLWFHTQ